MKNRENNVKPFEKLMREGLSCSLKEGSEYFPLSNVHKLGYKDEIQ